MCVGLFLSYCSSLISLSAMYQHQTFNHHSFIVGLDISGEHLPS